MKDSLSHLPQIKADEFELIAFNIRALCDDVQMATLSKQTGPQSQLFELLDYAYVGARYDRHYKITKEQLQQLAPPRQKTTRGDRENL